MQVVFEDGAETDDVEVVIHDPDAEVADLVNALGAEPGSGARLFVDGRELPPDRRLDRSGIADGAVIRLGPAADMSAAGGAEAGPAATGVATGAVAVEVVGGLDAGSRHVLAPGSWTIGRAGADVMVDDPTISEVHARIDVTADGQVEMADLGSLNGTWLAGAPVVEPTPIGPDAAVRLGASQLRVGPFVPDDNSPPAPIDHRFTTAGTRPFNRPPRPRPTIEHEPLDAPQSAVAAPSTSTVGIISVIAPLVLGLVMVKVFHNWLYGMRGP